MTTTLEQLRDIGDYLRQLISLDDEEFQAAIAEGFGDSPPDWAHKLPEKVWAYGALGTIREASILLSERLGIPPGSHYTAAGVRAELPIILSDTPGIQDEEER